MNFALTPGTKALDDNQVRVWVYSNNVLIRNKNAGTSYYSGTLKEGKGSVTIENLPPGSGYRIVVAAGKAEGDSFDTTRFGTSETFSMSAGLDVEISLALSELTMNRAPDLAGLNVKSVVPVFGGVAASTVTKIFAGGDVESIVEMPYTVSGTTTINSLSIGTDESNAEIVLVNKSNGVDKVTISQTVSSVASFGSKAAPSVLQSGAFNGVYFYQAEREFGGKTPGLAEWLRIDLDIEGMTGRPVMDFVVTQNPTTESIVGFFATRIVGAMRMGEDFIDSDFGDKDPIEVILDKDSELLQFFGEALPLIQAFGYLGGQERTLFLGTKNGVYRTTAEFGTTAIGNTTLVPGTKGLNIKKIVTNANGAAYMAETEVVVLKDNRVYLLPFVFGMTGAINDVAWNGTKLYVAGANGLAEIETSTFGQ
jgi:hypothetical protein